MLATVQYLLLQLRAQLCLLFDNIASNSEGAFLVAWITTEQMFEINLYLSINFTFLPSRIDPVFGVSTFLCFCVCDGCSYVICAVRLGPTLEAAFITPPCII